MCCGYARKSTNLVLRKPTGLRRRRGGFGIQTDRLTIPRVSRDYGVGLATGKSISSCWIILEIDRIKRAVSETQDEGALSGSKLGAIGGPRLH
jgi:hypothetical protein